MAINNDELNPEKRNFLLETVRIDGVCAPDEILSPGEFEKHGSFKAPKRKKEWLAGRLAAKTAVKNILKSDIDFKEIIIDYDESGRPVYQAGDRTHLLSISHSGDWAGAAIALDKCGFLGMDIEIAETRNKLWAEDYFHEEEVKDAVSDTVGENAMARVNEHLTKLWTIKEAFLKALGLGLTANLLDIKINGEVVFFGKALRKYNDMGKPKFDIISKRFAGNYYQSIVSQQND